MSTNINIEKENTTQQVMDQQTESIIQNGSDNFISHIEKTMGSLFLSVLLNWSNISQDQNIMSALNMESNNLCKTLKYQNPAYHDSFVQAHVLTLMLTMIVVLSRGINSQPENLPVYIKNTIRRMHESVSVSVDTNSTNSTMLNNTEINNSDENQSCAYIFDVD
jgi:hypothetical protein